MEGASESAALASFSCSDLGLGLTLTIGVLPPMCSVLRVGMVAGVIAPLRTFCLKAVFLASVRLNLSEITNDVYSV